VCRIAGSSKQLPASTFAEKYVSHPASDPSIPVDISYALDHSSSTLILLPSMTIIYSQSRPCHPYSLALHSISHLQPGRVSLQTWCDDVVAPQFAIFSNFLGPPPIVESEELCGTIKQRHLIDASYRFHAIFCGHLDLARPNAFSYPRRYLPLYGKVERGMRSGCHPEILRRVALQAIVLPNT